MKKYVEILPDGLTIIPKIESIKAVNNLESIFSSLNDGEKIFMLDHDDLFSNIIKNNESESNFKDYIKTLN